MVSLHDIPKDSQVYRFITSGKPGRCKFCSKYVQKLEFHHTAYAPESGLKLCHSCHHKIHYLPGRLTEHEKIILLQTRFTNQKVQEILNSPSSTLEKIYSLVAPSRNDYKKSKDLIPSKNSSSTPQKLFK